MSNAAAKRLIYRYMIPHISIFLYIMWERECSPARIIKKSTISQAFGINRTTPVIFSYILRIKRVLKRPWRERPPTSFGLHSIYFLFIVCATRLLLIIFVFIFSPRAGISVNAPLDKTIRETLIHFNWDSITDRPNWIIHCFGMGVKRDSILYRKKRIQLFFLPLSLKFK